VTFLADNYTNFRRTGKGQSDPVSELFELCLGTGQLLFELVDVLDKGLLLLLRRWVSPLYR
jgi:hypothetical protein